MKFLNKVKKTSVINATLICFKSSFLASLAAVIFEIFSGIIPSALVIYEAEFIDRSLLIVKGELGAIMKPLIMVVILICIQWFSAVFLSFFKVKLQNDVRRWMYPQIIEKKAKLEYKFYENSDVANVMKRITDNIEIKITSVFLQSLLFMNSCIFILGLLGILFSYMGLYTLIVFAPAAPLLYLANKSGKANFEAQSKTTIHRRKADYLETVLGSKETANERMLYQYQHEVNNQWQEAVKSYNKVLIKTRFAWFYKMKLGASVIALLNLIVTLILLPPLMKNAISLGFFISLINASYKLVNKLSWEITDIIDKISSDGIYIQELTKFLDLQEAEEKKEANPRRQENDVCIQFCNVTFQYPNSDRKILENISFQLYKNVSYGLIGLNGAGKSTIIKLLLGLYKDYQGDIFVNGVEVRQASREYLTQEFSVVFQDYARYGINLLENLIIPEQQDNTEIVCDAERLCKQLDIEKDIKKLDRGYQTELGKFEAKGQELSGGQWQKIAIIRASLKKTAISIMDEPSASLDPLVELEFFENYRSFINSPTSIVISHRIGVLKDLDRIIVLNGKRIEAIDSHQKLYEKNAFYREIYEKQKGWYMHENK